MTAFRCVPIPTIVAERFRETGRDDRGNLLLRRRAAGTGDAPCRHCLAFGEAGETMLLGSYALPRPDGIYWTPSPMFVHERPCTPFVGESRIAPTLLGESLRSVRAYDAEDLCLYDLGHACSGREIAAPLLRALDDPRTAFVNVHTAKPGCWLARVERVA